MSKPLYCLMRDRCGLTIAEAAAFHGCSRNSVTKWSSGGRNPPDGILDELRGLYALIKVASDGNTSMSELPAGARDAARGLAEIERKILIGKR